MTGKKEYHFTFLKATDPLGLQINEKANKLFALLQNFDATGLAISDVFKEYFINHHLGKRLFFSIENSAHILYQSIKRTNRKPEELNIIDYGAGLGTLYMLGGLLNFKRFVYNDYLPDWKDTAQSICHALNINITSYVTGDIDEVLAEAAKEGYLFDIIASRNVIEHIYNLPAFYAKIHQHNPATIVHSTTSANFHNPVMRLRHYFIHKRIEKESYWKERKAFIEKNWTSAKSEQVIDLTKKTRGMAGEDLLNAIKYYQQNIPLKPVPFLRTNTCDPVTGYWCEHLLKRNEYAQIITEAGFRIDFTAGYWDTHYKNPVMNLLAKCFNKIIVVLGKKGYILSPFVNVIAYN